MDAGLLLHMVSISFQDLRIIGIEAHRIFLIIEILAVLTSHDAVKTEKDEGEDDEHDESPKDELGVSRNLP